MSQKVPFAHLSVDLNDLEYRYQSLDEHLKNCAELAVSRCVVEWLKPAAGLVLLMHDEGKEAEIWQSYLIRSILDNLNGKSRVQKKLDHSTAGGLIIYAQSDLSAEWQELLGNIVWSHHGIRNMVCLNDQSRETTLKSKKLGDHQDVNPPNLSLDLQQKVENYISQLIDMPERFCYSGIQANTKVEKQELMFKRSMLYRYLLSLQVDADWTDSGNFANYRETDSTLKEQDWNELLRQYYSWIDSHSFPESRLNTIRQSISDQCAESAQCKEQIFQLNVPTGGGKTLSSLRFALERARMDQARHIIYAAPYNSILDQNYAVYQSIFEDPQQLLLHHSGVESIIADQEGSSQSAYEKLRRYRSYTENWLEPAIIATSTVQVFNTLFDGKLSSVRRMQALAGSVIIFDEVQAIPFKLYHLFTGAVNFLVEELNATIVLCSATQPAFTMLPEHPLHNKNIPQMVTLGMEELKVFERNSICFINENEGKIEPEDLVQHVKREAEHGKSILMVMNTRKECREMFETLQQEEIEQDIYALSTNMYPAHRKKVLKDIEEKLKSGKKLILISTSLIEAGVDLSFDCVYREQAGLESIIQAAGRCNRNGNNSSGLVWVFQLLENGAVPVSRNKDFDERFTCFKKVFYNPNRKNDLSEDSGYSGLENLNQKELVDQYFKRIVNDFKDDFDYVIDGKSAGTKSRRQKKINHSKNSVYGELTYYNSQKFPMADSFLTQKFKDAADHYQYIEDQGMDYVVECPESTDLIHQLSENPDRFSNNRKILRKLQEYSVHLSSSAVQHGAESYISVVETGPGKIWMIHENAYDSMTGVMIQS